MITIVEHGKRKRYPQYCSNCGCIFEIHCEDAVKTLTIDAKGQRKIWIKTQCPECGNYIKCENIGEQND